MYEIEARKNSQGKVTSYRLEWRVDGERFKDSFKRKVQADKFRSDLVSAASKGTPFDVSTGLPMSATSVLKPLAWYAFACDYTDSKWKDASAKHRADIARVLMLATPMFFVTGRGKPDAKLLRRALSRYAYNTKQRGDAPEDVKAALAWVERNTRNVDFVADEEVLRNVLDVITTKQDGTRMAAVTVKKYRGILHNALQHAVVKKALASNPLTGLSWISVKASSEVDRRSVLNPPQGRAFLAAVAEEEAAGGRQLVAMFGAMLYCGLRPEEAVEVADYNLVLPDLVKNPETGELEEPPEDDDWGELFVGPVSPEVARDWTDSGDVRDTRSMPKHRAENETRGPIPVPPVQVRLFRAHLKEFGVGANGRLFRGVRVDHVPGTTIRELHRRARAKVLSNTELDTPLAKRPYDLRHTCLSTQLNAGIPPQQVAQWAGNSVEVLLRTYAKCLTGQADVMRKRMAAALRV
ncbi:integrase [Catenulispora sp. GP43]|uniref:integrase n=1 Tax=Catenulispora sp. GP43 TaxID=3156263 RepID=UPI0035129FA1